MLKGTSIYLRALEPADVSFLYKWENDYSVWKVSNTLTPYSVHVLEQYIASSHLDIYTSKQLRLMICANDDKPVGCIDLFDFDPCNSRAGVGILIADKKDRNCGYASEALNLLIDYCFTTLRVHQLFCNITADNEASLRLFENKGFKITGLKKEWIKSGNDFIDEYILQRISG